MNKYENFLIEWVGENSGIKKEIIDINANMFENAYVDSLALFGLLVDIEMNFGITLDENDILDDKASTIKGFAEILIKKTK